MPAPYINPRALIPPRLPRDRQYSLEFDDPPPRTHALDLPETSRESERRNRFVYQERRLPEFFIQPEHRTIFDFIANGSGHGIIEAVAGAGKTRTLIETLRRIDGRVFFGAFGRDAMRDIQRRAEESRLVGYNVKIQTMHGAGLGVWLAHNQHSGQDERKTYRIIEAQYGRNYPLETFIINMVSYGKQLLAGVEFPINDKDQWNEIMLHFGADDAMSGDEVFSVDAALEHVISVFQASHDSCPETIDIDDMLYAPIAYETPFRKYDWVLLDECFPGDTPILTGLDGTCMTIQQMHDQQYTGPVVSWHPTRGTVISNVTGSKKTPVGKPLVRIITRQIGYGKNGKRLGPLTEKVRYGNRIVVCTEDHQIWTNKGWIAAKDLKKGDVVKHETIAPIVHDYQLRYMHSNAGRQALIDKADYTRMHKNGKHLPTKWTGTRGGNGRGPSKCEQLLLERLGKRWKWNVSIGTGKRIQGIPTHFKIDIADPVAQIAIEIDGSSHRNREDQDIKKQKFLEDLGWTVIRLTNQEALSLTDDLLNERIFGCPADAEVVEIESWNNRVHTHVYDISVADTHCYFAHGLLVHNCQDSNPARRMMAMRMLATRGRLLAVGDRFQSIMAFTGADHDAMDLIKRDFDATEMRLSTTWRCARAIVDHARQWCPWITARPDAPEGAIRPVRFVGAQSCPKCHGALEQVGSFMLAKVCAECHSTGLTTPRPWFEQDPVTPDDVILCRYNRPLIMTAYSFIRAGIPCKVRGRDIATRLIQLARKWRSVKTLEQLDIRLTQYLITQTQLAKDKGSKIKELEVSDRVGTLRVFMTECLARGQTTIEQLCAAINAVFDNNTDKVLTLSSIHRFKGQERNRVFWLQTEIRKGLKPWEEKQEQNANYVCVTRARTEIILVPQAVYDLQT